MQVGTPKHLRAVAERGHLDFGNARCARVTRMTRIMRGVPARLGYPDAATHPHRVPLLALVAAPRRAKGHAVRAQPTTGTSVPASP